MEYPLVKLEHGKDGYLSIESDCWRFGDDGPLTVTCLKGLEEGKRIKVQIWTKDGIYSGYATVGMSLKEDGELDFQAFETVDLVRLREYLDKMYEFAKDNMHLSMRLEMHHDPTDITPEGSPIKEWCEGNRRLSISLSEHKPPSFYISRHAQAIQSA